MRIRFPVAVLLIVTLCLPAVVPRECMGGPDRQEASTPGNDSARRDVKASHDRTIAILDLVDQGPSVELALLRVALAEMLTGDLSQYQGVRVVERVRVDQFLRESSLQAGFVDGASADRATRALSTDYLLTGSFQGKEDTVTIDVSLFEMGRQEPLLEWNRSAPVAQMHQLEQDLAGKILESLGIDDPVRRAPPPPKQGPTPTVAVLAFRNLSPSARLKAMESGFAEILQANLGAIADVRVVEREKLYAVLKEHQLSLSGLVNPQTAVQVGRLLGAERLIYGSFVELGDHLRLDVRLADTKTAAILRAEAAHGPTEDFARLLEDLALRLAVDLSVHPPPDAAQRVSAATPTREIETAIHYANAERLSHLGQYVESARNWERVALMEPDNVLAHYRWLRAWYAHGDYEKAIEAGEQALSMCPKPGEPRLKRYILDWLSNAYKRAGKYDDAVRLSQQCLKEFPGTAPHHSMGVACDLLRAGRRDEAVAMLEKYVDQHKASGDYESYATAVGYVYMYLDHEIRIVLASDEYRRQRHDPEYMKRIVELTRDSCKKRMAIYDLVLNEAQGERARSWQYWASNWALDFPMWIDQNGRYRGYLDERRKEEYLLRLLEVFSWLPELCQRARHQLASLLEKRGAWDEVIQSARAVLENPDKLRQDGLPYSWEQHGIARNGKYDKLISGQFQIASVLHEKLRRIEEAKAEYRRLVDQFGLAHLRGPNTALALHELGEEIRFPQKAALVWGAGSRAREAWARILEPMGFTVHHVAQYDLSAAHLGPYSLLILGRTGLLPYTPEEALAVRSFVATGGSLLVIVSPGWEHAAPGIHNCLLSFFGARAEGDMVVRAHSTRIVPHPITRGIDQAMAKNAVHLAVPAEAVLVEADGRTLLAAMPYRHGRVVLASFGQWFVPDPDVDIARFPLVGPHWTGSVARDTLPFETGRTLHLPLLRKAISWLTEPRPDSEAIRAMRKRFTDAQLVSLKVQFGAASSQDLTAALEGLAAEAGPGTWREEALWVAGESSLRLTYAPCNGYDNPRLGWWPGTDPPAPAPHYYQQLIDEFPDSPLRPYAQWRLAECRRCRPIYEARSRSADVSLRAEAIPLYEQVEAPKGSYVWAWTQLRIGALLLQSGQAAEALEHFRPVADLIDHSPEKSMAMLSAAACHLALESDEEAARYLKVAMSEPDLYWAAFYLPPYAAWYPLDTERRSLTGSTRKIAKKSLVALESSSN